MAVGSANVLRRAVWLLRTSFGIVTVATSVFAELLGPVAIAAWSLLVTGPVWAAWWLLVRRQ